MSVLLEVMSVVTRVRAFFATEPQQDQSQETDTRTTSLYHCASCDTTYVSEALNRCSQCEGAVETVPTEQDLGLV